MCAARIQNYYYNYRYCKRFYHTRQRSLNGASHREEPYISCLRFCVKYSSPDVYGNYVDKPYISCIRFWYTRARSLNGLSRGEKPLCPVFSFGIKYSSQVYLAIILINRICIIFGFGTELFSHYSLIWY